MNDNNRFSPTQQEILGVLSDGMPHPREDVMRAIGLSSSESDRRLFGSHLVKIRRRLKRRGETILAQLLNRKVHYRHVRLLASANDGRS